MDGADEPEPGHVGRRRVWLRLSAVAGAALVALIWTLAYLHGGGRIAHEGSNAGGPTPIGEALDMWFPLRSTRGPVKIVSIRPVGVDGGLRARAHLVRLDPGGLRGGGSYREPYDEPFEAVRVDHQVVRPGGFEDAIYGIHLEARPTREGDAHLRGVEITYRSGRFRERTARIDAPMCVRGITGPLATNTATCN